MFNKEVDSKGCFFMKKKIGHFCIIIYVMISVFITLCLLMYNEYNVTEFGNNVLVIVKNDNSGGYNKGDLIVVEKRKDYDVDDKIFYYVLKEKSYFINYGAVENEKSDSVIVQNEVIDKKMVIGTDEECLVISKLGNILAFLESKIGYLIFVILPIFLFFLWEIYSIIMELRKSSKEKR